VRGIGVTATALGALALVWVVVVWRWQDPFTAVYTAHEQGRLAGHYEQRLRSYAPASRSTALEARRYRLSLHPGDPVGRLSIPRLGLTKIVVDGTDESDLKRDRAVIWARSYRAKGSSSTSRAIAPRTAPPSRTSTACA
jgi:sortase (surface protein transpeptidase)